MSFLDPITAGGPATELATSDANTTVNVSEAAPPTAGQVLKATSAGAATWQDEAGGGAASGLQTTGEPVDTASAAPPVRGQVLMATGAETAEWRVPGLHYDSAIRYWASTSGEATIEPGTWGFVQTAPEGWTDPIVVYVVSSLTEPPVDSRFGLYVSPTIGVPVEVHLLGASQIQGIDGTLGSTVALRPGADYEWVFYHEDGAAVWGLVSDTTRLARALMVGDTILEIDGATPPEVGNVLKVMSEDTVAFASAGGGLVYGGEITTPAPGQWVYADGSDITMPASAVEGDSVGVLVSRDSNAARVLLPSGQELAIGAFTYDSSRPMPLNGGAYYEFTALEWGEALRWQPRGMSREATAPLAFRAAGTASQNYPNEWVRSTASSDVVNMPPTPRHGDCFGVYVDGEGASIVPATGQAIVSPDGMDVAGGVGPSSLSLEGASFYEWIWCEPEAFWFPRAQFLVLRPSAVQNAILNSSGDSYSFGDKRLAGVGDPTDAQDAATKNYADTMPIVSQSASFAATLDALHLIDTTAGNVTATLPTAAGNTGRQVRFKRITGGANTCVVATSSSQTIDGAATASMPSAWDYIAVVSDGANWLKIVKS